MSGICLSVNDATTNIFAILFIFFHQHNFAQTKNKHHKTNVKIYYFPWRIFFSNDQRFFCFRLVFMVWHLFFFQFIFHIRFESLYVRVCVLLFFLLLLLLLFFFCFTLCRLHNTRRSCQLVYGYWFKNCCWILRNVSSCLCCAVLSTMFDGIGV